MEDSVTYQAVIEKGRLEGRLEEARATLLRQGTAKFQAPSETTRQRIESITDLEQLEQWLVRVCSPPPPGTTWWTAKNPPSEIMP